MAASPNWGRCPCCLPPEFDIDPVPTRSRAPWAGPQGLRCGFVGQGSTSSAASSRGAPAARGGRGRGEGGLRALACSSSSSVAVAEEDTDTNKDIAQRPSSSERRDVVARGLTRFELGIEAPHQPDWEQVSPRVVCVLGQNPSAFTLNGTNCYLVGTGRERLLVDAGEEFYGAEVFMENLARCMEEHGIDGLSGLLITHMHHDHYGNIGRLHAKYGPMPVYSRELPEDYFFVLEGLRRRGLEHLLLDGDGKPAYNPKQAGGRPPPALPDDVDLSWAAHVVQHFPGGSIKDRVQHVFFFQWYGYQLVDCLRSGEYEWRRLSEGDVIQAEGASLLALHTPGHAEDHMSFLLDEEHALFSGDHVLGWGTTMVSDMRDYMATLRRMLALKPTRLYPGHGALIEDGVDLLTRYIDHRERREEQAWQALERRTAPVAVDEIARELYAETPEDRLWMARDNIEKLFRKFAGDSSVGAFIPLDEDPNILVPYTVPDSYAVRRLPKDLLWGAKRSLVAAGGNPWPGSKL